MTLFVNNLFFALKQVLRASKVIFILLAALNVISGFFPFLQLLITTKLINYLQTILEGDVDIRKILTLIGLQFLILLLREVISRFNIFFELILSQKMDYHLQKDLFVKLTKIDYVYFEDSNFINHLERVQGDMGGRFLATISSALEAIKNVVSFITVLIFLFTMHWTLVFVPILAALPSFIAESRFGSQSFFLMKFQTPLAREQGYIFSLFSQRNTNKEIRTYSSSNFLIEKWAHSFRKNNNDIMKMSLRHHIKSIIINTYTLTILLLGTSILALLFIKQSIRLGDFVASLDAIQKAQAIISGLSYIVNDLTSKHLYISDLKELLTLEEMQTMKESFPKKIEEIEVKDLTFTYPGTSKKIIENISFKVKANETIMIVGENGAGKTTLIKCLLGMYKANSGEIIFDGKEIKTINQHGLMKNISIIFQDFIKYEFTVKENIALEVEPDFYKMDEVARRLGADKYIEKLPSSYKSRLGRLFEDSIDLSGGQWQKIALARSLYKESQIIILDEPTAALDPSAEYDLFKNFKEISENKLTFYISHRMYSCHLADKILVLKDGKLIEIGSHQDLLNKGGEYSRLYSKQSSMYEINREEVTNS